MSSPHGPGAGHNSAPLPVAPVNAPTPGANPWGNGNVSTFKPAEKPSVNFNAVLGSERGILGRVDIDEHRAIQSAADAQDQYKQPGHEIWAGGAKWIMDLGHIAREGVSRKTGEKAGFTKQTLARIGALALAIPVGIPSAVVGLFTTYPIRIAANLNRGRRGFREIIRPVVPRQGEKPHQSGSGTSPYQVGHTPNTNPAPKPRSGKGKRGKRNTSYKGGRP